MHLTADMARTILRNVTYPGLTFIVGEGSAAPFWLQVQCDGICNVTGQRMKWHGRKWLLSQHMTKSEVVQTAFKAVLTAFEHEIRETFKYQGAAIFGPHFSVDRLVSLAADPNAQDVRD
ncbi:MAG: hypothetical protein GEU95_00995 [Rhizobiales bacterium]|nr:hypothetical protein [Hyphomicrobiales bacterium]